MVTQHLPDTTLLSKSSNSVTLMRYSRSFSETRILLKLFFGDKDPFKAFFGNKDPFEAVFTAEGKPMFCLSVTNVKCIGVVLLAIF